MSERTRAKEALRVEVKAEQAVKAQIEGKLPIVDEEEAPHQITEGFQVVRASMFSHAHDPHVCFSCSGFSFSGTCISRLNDSVETESGYRIVHQENVELLLNPVERMLAVRPCAGNHPNAFQWADGRGKSRWISAKAFCTILFDICGWNTDYRYKVPVTVRSKGNETVLFFDLDNYIGTLPRKRDTSEEEPSAYLLDRAARGRVPGKEARHALDPSTAYRDERQARTPHQYPHGGIAPKMKKAGLAVIGQACCFV